MQENPCLMPTSHFGDELSVARGLMGISLQQPPHGLSSGAGNRCQGRTEGAGLTSISAHLWGSSYSLPAAPFQLLLPRPQLASVKATSPHWCLPALACSHGFVLHMGQEELVWWNLTEQSPQQQEDNLIAFSTKEAAPRN